MRMLSTSFFIFLALSAFSGGNVFYSKNAIEKTPFNGKWMPDKNYQAELRNQSSWENFLSRNGSWWVLFNEENRKPHRAFGQGIPVSGNSWEDKARNFIQNELNDFHIPMQSLVLQGVSQNEKHHFVNFYQTHNGKKVLESRFTVKITNDSKVIMFGADVYSDIQAPTQPSISTGSAITYAVSGLTETVTGTNLHPDLFIFPVPKDKSYEYKLVYRVDVQTLDTEMVPADYMTYVDAASGEIIYRQNQVLHFHGDHNKTKKMAPAGIDVNTQGTVYTTHSFNPSSTEVLPNMDFTIGAANLMTDVTGFLATGIPGPQTGTFHLKGTWSTIRTNNVTPSMTFNLVDGSNTMDFTAGTIRDRSAFYHVNLVHDHCKIVLPAFTGMDFSLTTNVDLTSGNCNAFYNGVSINFYAQANGCTSFATVGDVVYHEYGHGINDNFYSDNGGNFINGAMGEGYADFWAYSITESPVLGYGTDLAVATEYIRRYDTGRKVYPIDIVGEVHSDGEIIAGAWWDTYLNLGSDMNMTNQLFAAAYPGLQAQTFNGNEGKAYTDVLIDVLQADDNDADLTNGTPNGMAIVNAFALHGITLISNAELIHTAIATHADNVPVTINAELDLNFPYTNYVGAVNCYYKINNGSWNTTAMINTVGSMYTVDIPAQPIGTVVSYYLGAEDINNQLTAVVPVGAEAADPNIPHFIMIGFALKKTDDAGDFTTELGTWQITLPTDNNTTGDWMMGIPIGSFSDPADTSTVVQPYYQHTPGGEFCFFTGNAASVNDGLGTADVDGGHTTLQSASIDMSAYVNPAVSYYRWYTNNPPSGANPNADWWQVSISNNGGSSWVKVEDTKTSDRQWRRYVFRVQDYVTPTNNMKIKFVASDSIRPGTNLDGGSLIEAAIDDIQIWDNMDPNAVNEIVPQGMQILIAPNPANDFVNITLELLEGGDADILITDITGKQVIRQSIKGASPGLKNTGFDVAHLESGMYQVLIHYQGKTFAAKLVLTR